jgi:non-ribosomal peptide synthetase component F
VASPASIIGRFHECAGENPKAVAIQDGDRTVTYGQLASQVGGLARQLRGAGVLPETIVGVCLERSADLVVAILGVLESGGAFLPLEPVVTGDSRSGARASHGEPSSRAYHAPGRAIGKYAAAADA